jgi:NADPH-dependent curcumin reductase CurA
MAQSPTTNRRIVLASRPKAAPSLADFRLDEAPVPVPGPGQMLLRTLWLSLDPYMRGRMSDGPSYAAPVAIGAPMVGGTIGQVVTSHLEGYAAGDLVVSYNGWQDYALSDGTGIVPVPKGLDRPSLALGVLGMPGFTGYMGLMDIGKPKQGETVVVSAATGAVGAVVGQVAKLQGCRVVGIAGGAAKCAYAVETLGFDACVDHHGDDLKSRLEAACPNGIDVYFENVGGKVFLAVLPLLNALARIPLCGLIAQYNADRLPEGPDRSPQIMRALLTKRITMRGFIVTLDYGHRLGEFLGAMGAYVAEGKVKFREDVVDGLERAPEAFLGLLEGKNFGKLLVEVGAV